MSNKSHILEIKEGTFKVKTWVYEGYIIHTTTGDILAGINTGQSCCEVYGYLISLDDYKSLVGAEVLKVETVDTSCNPRALEYNCITEEACIFVNIVTNKGTFQITVYNSHNGYYGHSVYVSNCDKVLSNTYL